MADTVAADTQWTPNEAAQFTAKVAGQAQRAVVPRGNSGPLGARVESTKIMDRMERLVLNSATAMEHADRLRGRILRANGIGEAQPEMKLSTLVDYVEAVERQLSRVIETLTELETAF